MITATLTDDSGTLNFPALEVPVVVETLEGSTDVVTLDNNMRTDFTNPKRKVTIPYDTLTEDEFLDFKAYFDRQFTDFKYPLLSISELGITSMPARMYLNPQSVWNHCASVEDVEIVFRESTQMPDIGSS